MIQQILGLGTQVGGSVVGHKTAKKNREAQRKENELNRNFSREQYNTLRTHSLEDWNRQNEYNHPLQQMQRLREAGLNPNLVYGKGADNTAAMIRGSQANKVQTDAPTYDINAAMSPVITAANLGSIAAQTDNLHEQTRVLEQDKMLKMAQTIKAMEEGKNTKFDRLLKELIKNDLISQASLANQKTMAEIEESQHKASWMYQQTETERKRTRLVSTQAKYEEIKTALLNKGLTPQSESYLTLMNAWQSASPKEKALIEQLLGINIAGNAANLGKGLLTPNLLKFLK